MKLSPKGHQIQTTSRATPIKPATRVRYPVGPNQIHGIPERSIEGVLLGFSVPRGYAVIALDTGEEYLAHPEWMENAALADVERAFARVEEVQREAARVGKVLDALDRE